MRIVVSECANDYMIFGNNVAIIYITHAYVWKF